MTEYEKAIVEADAKIVFPPEMVKLPLGKLFPKPVLNN